MTDRRARRALIIAAAVLLTGGVPVLAAMLSGGAPRPGSDSFGRSVNPRGRLTELGYFVIGSSLTPDGRFLWTIGGGRTANDVQITRLADGKVIQTIDDPRQALQGGIAISADGRRAYVSDTHDAVGVRTFSVDRRSGRAQASGHIPLPAPQGQAPPDDFAPRPPTSGGQSYPSGMALTRTGDKLVVAENLDDRAAVVDLPSGRSTEVVLKNPSPTGDHALPVNVAIVGRRAFIANEGDGTVSAFSIDDPSAGVQTVTPKPSAPDPVAEDAAKTHPYGILAAPDGHALYLTETNADRVLVLNPADLQAPAHVIYVRRAEGLGTSPTGLALTADGGTLLVADAGENAVRAIALTARTLIGPHRRARRVEPGDEIASIPTGIYPTRVHIDPVNGQLLVVSTYGTGPGSTANSDQAGPGVGDPQQVSIRILSDLQAFGLPLKAGSRDTALISIGDGGRSAVPPGFAAKPPPDTPIVGSDGGPSRQIKYVFYVVAENKTYDSMLGDLTRNPRSPLDAGKQKVGEGDPCIVVFGETRSLPHNPDGSPCPQSRFMTRDRGVRVNNPGQLADGSPITPNQHRISRQFVTFDNTYADTTTSDDGHLFTSSGFQSDYEIRATEANNGPSPRPFDLVYPQAAPPTGFIFDQLARQNISFFNYGEAVSGTLVPDTQLTPEERAIREKVFANSDYATYPSSAAIDTNPISVGVSPNVNDPSALAGAGRERVDDSIQPNETQGTVAQTPAGATVPTRQSRLMAFEQRFLPELSGPGCQAAPQDPAVCTVPQFNELIMANNHTGGTTPGARTPDALVRDNDLAIGQLADLISHSPIWRYSAIFVLQDDSQDSSDHRDTRRISAFVISPYAKHQYVDSTHHDQASFLHTMLDIVGARPQYLQVAMAPPLYSAFQAKPDLTPFAAQSFTQAQLDEINTPHAPMAKESAAQLWQADRVAPALANRVILAYRYGSTAVCRYMTTRAGGNPCTGGKR